MTRVLAVVVAHNEADILGATLDALIAEGCDAYVIDHESTDATRDIARARLGAGVVGLESFPDDCGAGAHNRGRMVWTELLARRQAIVESHDYDWYVLHDADEFRESPWPGTTLAEGLARAEALGFDAVNFRVYDFRPTSGAYTGGDPRPVLTGYEPGGDHDAAQVKAFKRPASGLDIASFGGHDVRFPGRRVCPVPFLLRHYPIRSPEHGRRKVLGERLPRFSDAERARGWHVQYDAIAAEARFRWDADALEEWNGDAVRAAVLGEAMSTLLTASVTRGQTLAGMTLNRPATSAWLERRTGTPVSAGDYAAAHAGLRELIASADAGSAVRAAGAAAPLLDGLLAALAAQAETGGDVLDLARLRLLRRRVAAALAPALDGARGFVTLVDAAAAVEQPALLRSFGEAFGPADDATLVIHAPGWDEERIGGELLPALAAARLDGDDAPDLLAVTDAAVRPEALAARADAVLSSHGAAADPGALRRLAEARWAAA